MTQWITTELLETVLEKARQSPRGRMNFNFHASLDDNPNRFLNVMLRGTYVTPHRHTDPPKPESFVVMEGQVACVLFDDDGNVIEARAMGPGAPALGIDIPPGVWHTLVVLTDHAVCFEVKPGPYAQAGDKDFAPWAPREGAPGAQEYLDRLSLYLTQSPAIR